MSDDPQVQKVFQQAPWRTQTQATSLVLAAVVIVAAIGALYLAQASRTAAAGRRLQQYEERREQLELENAQMRAEIAALQSVPRLIERAEELGFRQARADEVRYMPVTGVTEAELEPATVEENVALPYPGEQEVPTYDETLESWLAERLAALRLRIMGSGNDE